MAGLLPLSNSQQFDSNGRLLAGARLFIFDGGTGTPRVAYRDLALTSPHPNPILADAAGRIPLAYLNDGYYRQRLTSKTGVLIFDQDNIPVLTSSAGGSGTSVDPDSVYKTRDIKLRFDDQPLAGYVRMNGKTIGSATSGATERANVDTQPLYEELWLFDNIAVAAGKGASAAADFAANKALTIPDCQGKSLFGLGDMGGTANAAFTALLSGTNTAEPGATGGANTVTLVQANVPSYTLTGGTVATLAVTGTTSAESLDHTHTFSDTSSGQSASHSHVYDRINSAQTVQSGAGIAVAAFSVAATDSGAASVDHTHDVSGTTSGASNNHSHTLNGTGTGSGVQISSGGSGTAVNKLPPLMTLMIYVRL